ncbi:MAG: hypothetical protein WBR18_14470 [Anaerolineales bacterium]
MAGALIPLLASHLMVDFMVWPRGYRQNAKWFRAVGHAGLYAVAGYLLLGRWRLWWILPLLLAYDLLIRLPQTLRSRRREMESWIQFAVDQAAHFVGLAGLAGIIVDIPTELARSTWLALWGDVYLDSLVVVAGAVTAIWVGAVVIGYSVQPFVDELQQARAESKPPQTPIGLGRGFEVGGKRIGQLERALIYLLILVGEPTAIGFLIAAKSIFRIGELREGANRMEAEYILIGTLMSFLFGLLVAYLARAYLMR